MTMDRIDPQAQSLSTAIGKVETRRFCGICQSSSLEPIIELPKLPLTGRYCFDPRAESSPLFDQTVIRCKECGHFQLRQILTPDLLYGDQYGFRSSKSATAQAGTQFFLSSLRSFIGEEKFNCALDVGCNDLHLLRQLKSRAQTRVGLDPVWSQKKPDPEDADIVVCGSVIEDPQLESYLPEQPDLIVCRHTLEHIANPRQVLVKLKSLSRPGAILVFEVPGLEGLVERKRFDQIFHEHLQYFSLPSFRRLAAEVGLSFICTTENYHDWGARFIAFRNDGKYSWPNECETITTNKILDSYSYFQRQMETSTKAIDLLNQPLIGFGAAQMVPVLNYHLNGILAKLELFLDDDANKKGLYYPQLAVPIVHRKDYVIPTSASIVITALDSIQPIIKTLLDQRPRHIVNPLGII